MSTKSDYSAEEWKAISGAPVAAGLFIALSEMSDPLGIAREAMVVGRAIAASARGDPPEIVKSLAESVTVDGGHAQLPDLSAGDCAQTRAALISAVANAVEAVARRSPGEVEAFKACLASVAARVVQASKNAGASGLGGTVVSRQQQEAVARLADVLGVDAHRRAARAKPRD
jgi:hypothetical protein